MLYHLMGVISSLLFVLTWFGFGSQLLTIEKRRNAGLTPTQSLSVNQFASSFLAFYANFIFGIAVESFNHYLVWTRCGALILILIILYRIWQERRTCVSAVTLWLAVAAFLAGFVSIAYRPYPDLAKLGANTLMLAVTVILVQGTFYQWLKLRRSQNVGALSVVLFRSILIKDISTLAFALTMPFAIAWPLLLLNGASVITRGALLLQIEWLNKRQKSEKPRLEE